ncbi:MAG: dihydrodipicolinate synthase family protein [Acidimicrobiia bacterium]|nr:dihydrodipicolinate synthase family protein [Acidimicrobiia bacterium]
MTKQYRGVFPAIVAPQDEHNEILWDVMAELAQRQVAEGASGFLVNGHTGEHMMLSGEERRTALRVVREAVGPDIPIVAGVHVQAAWKFGSRAESAAEMGADSVLIFSPFSFARGAFAFAPEAVVDYYRKCATDSALPTFFMQYRPQTNLMMPSHVLGEIAALPGMIGVKQEVEDAIEYERDLVTLREANPDLAILTATERGLFGNYMLGADGCTIGLANFVAPVKRLQDAAWSGDLEAARQAAADLRPLADAIYRPPSYRWSARLKYAIHAAGMMPTGNIRSPLFPATEPERRVIDDVIASMKVPA